MRKFIISVLLATAVTATPAFAQSDKQDRQAARQEARAERQQAREQARPQAPARAQPNFEAPRPNFAAQANMQPQSRPNVDRQQWSRPPEAIQGGDRRFSGSDVQQRQWSRPAPQPQDVRSRYAGQVNPDSVANWRQQQREQMRQDRFGESGQQRYVRTAPPAYARPDRPAPVPQTAYNYDQRRSPQWNTNWHHDRDHDWRRYRDEHRSVFRVGIYSDPFGWGYQRYNVGWRLYPAYYQQNYWLADPYMYDLPPAPYPLEWVRYYDDALLVNVFTGQVVDVMYDFFW